MYSDQPEMYSDQPEMYSDQPEMYCDQPEMYSDQPEMNSDHPEMYCDQHEMYCDQHEMYRKSFFIPFSNVWSAVCDVGQSLDQHVANTTCMILVGHSVRANNRQFLNFIHSATYNLVSVLHNRCRV